MPDLSVEPSFQHKLEQFNPGIVWLDHENRVTALNDVAVQVLVPAARQATGVSAENLFGLDVLMLHPPKSREKIKFLIRESEAAHHSLSSLPPLAMMINIPDRVLMIKVSHMGGTGSHLGTCMIFYDLTDVTTAPHLPSISKTNPETLRQLSRIPVYKQNRIMLVNVNDIMHFEGEGHYTTIHAVTGQFLSNLSMSMLQARLDPQRFLRVHRSHIVNVDHVSEIARDGDSFTLGIANSECPAVPVSRNRLAQVKEFLGLA
jgi:hypothetical protein